jgi:hypothetical protein
MRKLYGDFKDYMTRGGCFDEPKKYMHAHDRRPDLQFWNSDPDTGFRCVEVKPSGKRPKRV